MTQRFAILFLVTVSIVLGLLVLAATQPRSSANWSFEEMRYSSCFHDIQVANTQTTDMSEQVNMYVQFFAAQSFRYHEIGLPPMVMVNGQDPGFIRIWLWEDCEGSEPVIRFLKDHFEAYGPPGAQVRLLHSGGGASQ